MLLLRQCKKKNESQSLKYFILALKHSIHIKRNLGILDAIHCHFIAFMFIAVLPSIQLQLHNIQAS